MERCLLNLKQIQTAKEFCEGGPSQPVPAESVLPQLKDRKLPVCPAGGAYLINALFQNPTCTTHGDLLDNCDARGRLSPLKIHTRQLLNDGHFKFDLLEVDEHGLLRLRFTDNAITDLTILKGLPITWLSLEGCTNITDLRPLKGAPLTSLSIGETSVTDLSPLTGAPLTYLNGPDGVTDLSPLKGMPLDILYLDNADIHHLGPLRGAPLTHLLLGNAIVQDLTPLAGMPLKHLHLPLQSITNDVTFIRSIKTIKQFRARRQDICTSPEEFWKMFDGHFRSNMVVEPDGAANGSQPIRSVTNRTSTAAGSLR